MLLACQKRLVRPRAGSRTELAGCSSPATVSPDMESAEIIRLESSWKDRLHTREFGMNEN
jgi:hypothetical protein